jgi:hypothetical protein
MVNRSFHGKVELKDFSPFWFPAHHGPVAQIHDFPYWNLVAEEGGDLHGRR